MPKRRERVAPSPTSTGGEFRYATSDAVDGWEALCLVAPANARVAWDRLTSDPRQRDSRQHPLRGQLGERVVNGEQLEQWQYEVTSGGRLWYCIDDRLRTVWLTDAMPGHPKVTE